MGATETSHEGTLPEAKPPRQPRRLWPAVRALLRTRIIAGLAMVIPLWITWAVAKFVFDKMSSATKPIVEWIVTRIVVYQQQKRALSEGVVWPPVDALPATPPGTETAITGALPQQMADAAQTVPPGTGDVAAPTLSQHVTDVVQALPVGTEDAIASAVPVYVHWIVPIIAVLLTLFSLYLLGLLTANVFGRRLVLLVERLFESLPLVKTIYGSSKRIILTLGGSDAMQFKRVVLVEFPRPGMKCIGFLTSVIKDTDTGRKMATVFISTTPNPTTGYMQIVPLDEVSETGWSVEEAVKLLMSGGLLSPGTVRFDKVHPVRWDKPTSIVDSSSITGTSGAPST